MMAARLRRWLSGKWQTPAGWALGCAVVLPAGLLAIPVSARVSPPVAVGACVAGLLLALASAAGFFAIKRNNWLLAAPLAAGLSFSMFLALVEGWSAQVHAVLNVAQIVLGIVVVGFFLVVIVFVVRVRRRVNRAMRQIGLEAGETIAREGLFREDGERIVVCVSRGALALRALVVAGGLAALVGLAFLVVAMDPAGGFLWVIVGLGVAALVGLGLPALALTLVRLVIGGPSLIVTADGIEDRCSLIVTGRGLLRWNEMLDVDEYLSHASLGIIYHYLDINVSDARAISQRQEPLTRALATIIPGTRQPLGFRISRALLDRPVAQLVAEINAYIARHAPEGSWRREVAARAETDKTERVDG